MEDRSQTAVYLQQFWVTKQSNTEGYARQFDKNPIPLKPFEVGVDGCSRVPSCAIHVPRIPR